MSPLGHADPFVRSTDEGHGAMELSLPAAGRPLDALIVLAWLAGWGLGLWAILQFVATGDIGSGEGSSLADWALVWALAGTCALVRLAWLMVGRERVTVSAGTLSIWRGIVGLGVTHSYPLGEVEDLHSIRHDLDTLPEAGIEWKHRGASGVRFRFAGRVVRFAHALDEAAAVEVVDRMRRAHPIDGQPHSSLRRIA